MTDVAERSPLAIYQEHCDRGELAYQVDEAGNPVFYPRLMAPGSGGALRWKVSTGRGTVHATTTLHPRNAEPYDVSLIEVDEGFRMMSRVEGIDPRDVHIDVLALYDAFTYNTLVFLEDLGYCAKGEGGPFVSGGRIAPGGELPVNTSGGGLSYCHPGMYGLFLLIEAARQTWAIMAHNTRDGAPRLLGECSLPLTGRGCITRVYTDIAVIDVTAAGFMVRALLATVVAAELRKRTGAPVAIADDCAVLVAPELD